MQENKMECLQDLYRYLSDKYDEAALSWASAEQGEDIDKYNEECNLLRDAIKLVEETMWEQTE